MKKLIAILSVALFSFNGTTQTALDFDGVDDHVLIPGAGALLNGDNTWSIEFWVQDPDNSCYPFAINATDYVLIHPAGTIVFYSAGGTFQSNNATWIADGNPHHVAFVSYGVGNQQIFVDGNPVGMQSQGHSGFTGIAAEDFSIGSDFVATTQIVDDFRIWDDARTPAEILANYNACLTGSEPNLVLLYDFEDGTGSSTVTNLGSGGAAYNGVLTNMDAATDWVAGFNGCTAATEALQFDGVDDFIATSTNVGIEDISDNGFTIEAWIYPTSPTMVRTILSKPGDYQLMITFFQLSATVWIDGTTDAMNITVPNTLNGSMWNHLAFTWDGTNGIFYVNGVQTVGTVSGPTVNTNVGNLSIGDSQLSPGTPYVGDMDEVRIWTCVKSPAEVVADMSAVHTGTENGLALFYDFSDGSGSTVTDLSVNGNDATLFNGTVWTPGVTTSGAPSFGGCPVPTEALQYDGVNDIVSTTTNTNIEDICDNGFTMEAWVYANSTSVVRNIIRKQEDYNLYLINGTLFAEIWADGTTNRTTIQGPAGFPTGSWTHVAFSWDGSVGNFYVNGAQTLGINSAPTVVAGTENLCIGNSSIFPNAWDGFIDEIRIWTCVKSPAEVVADMSAAHTGTETGLALFYDFSDGSGATVTDLSVNGNDGTLANGPVWVPGVATAGAPTFTGCALNPNHYWVGGTGNWSDAANHWANTSGGVPGSAGVPGATDNAIFDANSGLIAASVVTIDQLVEIDTLDFSGVPNQFTYNNGGTFDVTIHGSLFGNPSGALTSGTWGEIIFDAATAGEDITSGGTIWAQDFRIIGAQMNITDNLDLTTGTLFTDAGGFVLNGNNLACAQFVSNTTNARVIDVSNSTINVTEGLWDMVGTNVTLTATSSSILLGDLAGVANFT
ncbi:MAG: hypothetical protein EP322_00690, partial [Bacteroidetes bacterium]